ncbi:MAG: hypothetical protein EOO90_10315 [Pedobacter sp.]|nr:MAG: hypothetical protein EOO90_10315 [Pedobacter sp.]
MRALLCLFSLLLFTALTADAQSQDTPVFKLDTPNPTADKPQSKLWFMDGQWWALLPKQNGPSLWQRTAKGWIEDSSIHQKLSGNPSRVDVWSTGNQVMAVGVGTNYLVVYKLLRQGNSWQVDIVARLETPKDLKGNIESATIVRDGSGYWWVASDFGDRLLVWSSSDGKNWEAAMELANGLHQDDISTLAIVPGGIGVIWSDQNQDAVKFRFHGDRERNWSEVSLIEQGNHTADDHLRASTGDDGILWVATKNSVDSVRKPQLVLRVRGINGKWKNYPFADLDVVKKPSRPAVFTVDGKRTVLLGYTIYDGVDTNLGEIKFGIVDTSKKSVLSELKTVILPKSNSAKNTFRINDITGPKGSFPKDGPWIILASDQFGNIYEADLRSILGNDNKK